MKTVARIVAACTLSSIAAAWRPPDAAAGSIVIRSLGGQAAPYGSMTLSLAAPDDRPMGSSIINCPRPAISGGTDWLTTCAISREDLARGFVGPPELLRMVVSAPRTTAVGSCSTKFVSWGGPCTGKGNERLGGGGVGYECPFTVPGNLASMDYEITGTFEPSPGNFDPATCNRNGLNPTTTTTQSSGSTTTTTTFPRPPLDRFMDNLTFALINDLHLELAKALAGVVVRELTKLNIAAANAPRGTLSATVTTPPAAPQVADSIRAVAGARVIVKGKRKIKREGDVNLVMKVTRTGRRLLKQGASFTAMLELTFRGPIGEATRSATLTVP